MVHAYPQQLPFGTAAGTHQLHHWARVQRSGGHPEGDDQHRRAAQEGGIRRASAGQVVRPNIPPHTHTHHFTLLMYVYRLTGTPACRRPRIHPSAEASIRVWATSITRTISGRIGHRRLSAAGTDHAMLANISATCGTRTSPRSPWPTARMRKRFSSAAQPRSSSSIHPRTLCSSTVRIHIGVLDVAWHVSLTAKRCLFRCVPHCALPARSARGLATQV